MRLPSAPDAPNFEETGSIRIATGARDPSYPDRARIDSDVRYLLRPPSTPWITFDKEPKQEIRFPEERPTVAPAPPPAEPSNVVVATDIRPPEPSLFDTTHDEPHVPPVAHPRRIMVALGATLGLAAMIVASLLVFAPKHPAPNAAAASAPAAKSEVAPPPVVAPAPPPPPTATEAKAKDGWAKLTIKGPAKSHRVYLDGKMLLGQGQRSFTVRCGTHSIAVGNKTDAKDVDVPCNGEYVVSKTTP
jgi:hypothetical protein